MIGNPPEIIDKPPKEIINDKLNIKLWQFIKEEYNPVQKKIKNQKICRFQ